MKAWIGSALIAAAILGAWGTAMPEQDEDLTALKAELASIGDKLEAAVLAGDLETQIEYFAEDAVFCPDMHAPIRGRKAIREAMEQNQREGVKVLSYDAQSESIFTCGEHVFDRGHFTHQAASRDHPEPLTISGSYASVWRRQADGGLQMEFVIWNLDSNPWD